MGLLVITRGRPSSGHPLSIARGMLGSINSLRAALSGSRPAGRSWLHSHGNARLYRDNVRSSIPLLWRRKTASKETNIGTFKEWVRAQVLSKRKYTTVFQLVGYILFRNTVDYYVDRRRFDYLDHNEGSRLETNVCETEVGLQPIRE